MKKLMILSLTIFCINIDAQDTLSNKKIVTFSPQYLIKYGIRLDFERQIAKNRSLAIAPQLYLSEKKSNSEYPSTDRDDFNLLAGAGLALSVKNFANDNSCSGLYLSYGLGYNYFYSEYYEEVENDFEIAKASIHKLGFDITLGYQIIIKEIIALDVYSGLGGRKSFIENGDYHNNKFNGYPTGYNLTGNIFLIGIRVGIVQ